MTEYRWCAVDAEGDAGKLGLLGVAIVSHEDRIWLTERESIRAELCRQAALGSTFLAHNAQYDLGVIWWQLGLPMRAHGNNGRFTHGTWKYARRAKEAQLWDTWELSGRISLADLGTSLGLPKYSTPQRLLGSDPDRYAWRCETHGRGECEECYAIRDAEIVYRFMTGWEATLRGWGTVPERRLAGTSQQVWQALDQPARAAPLSPKTRKLGRGAYHGGRVECYRLGTVGPIWTADVQSMYASCMRSTPMPDPSTVIYVTSMKPEHVQWEREGVAEVDVLVPPMHVPPLPFRRGKRLLYPVGCFTTCCTLQELRYAQALGCVVERVHRMAFSVGNVWPFAQTIDVLWALREAYIKQGDPRALHAKLLLNNLYGMFGVRETRQARTSQLWTKVENPRPGEWDNWSFIDGQLVVQKDRGQTFLNPGANVLWAAQIAGAARVKLHQLQLLQGADLVYSDTDCIFSTAPIIGLGDGLGGLKDTGSYQQAIIAGPKMYALQEMGGDWHARCKGTKRDVALQFLRAGYATWTEPVGPLQAAKRGVPAGTWVEVHRESHPVEPRRTVLNPSIMTSGVGYSETAPPVEGRVLWAETVRLR